jgi:hypothetical protein
MSEALSTKSMPTPANAQNLPPQQRIHSRVNSAGLRVAALTSASACHFIRDGRRPSFQPSPSGQGAIGSHDTLGIPWPEQQESERRTGMANPLRATDLMEN